MFFFLQDLSINALWISHISLLWALLYNQHHVIHTNGLESIYIMVCVLWHDLHVSTLTTVHFKSTGGQHLTVIACAPWGHPVVIIYCFMVDKVSLQKASNWSMETLVTFQNDMTLKKRKKKGFIFDLIGVSHWALLEVAFILTKKN